MRDANNVISPEWSGLRRRVAPNYHEFSGDQAPIFNSEFRCYRSGFLYWWGVVRVYFAFALVACLRRSWSSHYSLVLFLKSHCKVAFWMNSDNSVQILCLLSFCSIWITLSLLGNIDVYLHKYLRGLLCFAEKRLEDTNISLQKVRITTFFLLCKFPSSQNFKCTTRNFISLKMP